MVEYIGDGNPSGSSFGSSTTELISFHNSTPIAQATVAATTTTTATTTALQVDIDAIRTALINKGIIA